jgi:competence protein ComEC
MALLFLIFIFTYCLIKKIKTASFIIMIISFTIGYLYSGYFWESRMAEAKKYDEKVVNMKAILISEGIQKNKNIEYIADDVEVVGENIRSRILLRSNKKYKVGDKIEVTALLKIPDGARNFNGFSYQRYLSSMNIFMICEVQDNANILSEGNMGIIKKISLYLKNMIIERVDNNLPQTEASILKASLVGDDYSIDEEIETMYKDAGMIHLLVVSGGHIAFVILIFSYIIKKINIPRNKQNFILSFIVIVYIFMTGAEPSVLRAGVGAIIILTADTIGRQNDSITTIFLNLMNI